MHLDNAPMEWPVKMKWEQMLKDILAGLEDGAPRFRDLKWRGVFEGQVDTSPLQTLKDTFSGNLPKFSLPRKSKCFLNTTLLSMLQRR